MFILGINAYHGDVSAVLIRNGQLVAALEEERFRRIKHVAGFPDRAIQHCLEIAGISGAEVDRIAISRDPTANIGKKVAFVLTRRPSLKLVWERARSSRKVFDVRGNLADALNIAEGDLPPVHNVEHHPAHLASAFFVSPFEDAAVCAIDAMGDFVSTSMAAGCGSHLEILDKVYYPHSLGMLYTAVTQYLGFPYYGDEYKVMGLAPYGEPAYVDELRQLVRLGEDGSFELDLDYFRHWQEEFDMDWEEGAPEFGSIYTSKLKNLLGPERTPETELTQRHMDIARSLQAVHEECVFHVLRGLHERTGSPRLCLAGGCAMNSVANGKVREQTAFEEVYIQPAAGDNGTALGAAYYLWNQVLEKPRSFVMDHAFWGTYYPDLDPSTVGNLQLDDTGKYEVDKYENIEEMCRNTAVLLAQGHVVGWFRGRMEWGARALGNRSILADPQRDDVRDLINHKIKYREEFRPFAPSILREALDEYFIGAAHDPFMQQVYSVREEKRNELPGITHVDGSGRIQTVDRETNPEYHRLISEFADLTGTPLLLNTSFNENEPIVESPEQALDCFLRTDMDAVVIGDTLIRRRTV